MLALRNGSGKSTSLRVDLDYSQAIAITSDFEFPPSLSTPTRVNLGVNPNVYYWGIPPVPGIELWSPAFISTALWLDAATTDSLIIDGSENLAQWSDLSGNSRHAIQTTPSARPSITPAYLNGYSAVSFDGINEFLRGAGTNPILDSDDFTLFVVGATSTFARGSDGFGSGWSVIVANGGNVVTSSPVVNYSAAGSSPYPTTALVRCLQWDSGTFLKYFQDGSLLNTTTPVGTGLRSSTVTYEIGRINGTFFPQATAEIIWIPGLVSQDILDRANGYTHHKWGIQSRLAADHPYKANPPTIL